MPVVQNTSFHYITDLRNDSAAFDDFARRIGLLPALD